MPLPQHQWTLEEAQNIAQVFDLYHPKDDTPWERVNAARKVLEWAWKTYRQGEMPDSLKDHPLEVMEEIVKKVRSPDIYHFPEPPAEKFKEDLGIDLDESTREITPEEQQELRWHELTDYLTPKDKVKAYQEAIKSEDYERAQVIWNDMDPDERSFVMAGIRQSFPFKMLRLANALHKRGLQKEAKKIIKTVLWKL